MKNKPSLSRRRFLGRAAAAGAAGVVAPAFIHSCAPSQNLKEVEYPLCSMLDQAPDGTELKAGLIGCGGRGTGAAQNFLDAGPNLKVVALADVIPDKLNAAKKTLAEKKDNVVPDENCFIGFDAYEKLIDLDLDIVLIATPPHFRPDHVAAAVQARKHVFMEKPVAVDPKGARSIMASAKKAEGMGLSMVAGTQRRHQRSYVEAYKKVAGGMIGELTGGNVYWNGGKLWHRDPNPSWNEMEYMIRNWVNWTWLSGDHIVEQHVHNLDVAHWFFGAHPVKALGFGSRQRRVTGDQFDNFSIDFVFEDGRHLHSMCRQINGCNGGVYERLQGQNGSTNAKDIINGLNGETLWEYPYELDEEGKRIGPLSPYVQEHVDLVNAIRTDTPINEGENVAESTMVAIMGRISAYTGKETTWDEMMNTDLKLGPKVYAMGDVDVDKAVPVPGDAWKPKA